MVEGFADFFGVGVDHYPSWRHENGSRDLDYAASDCIQLAGALKGVGIVTAPVVLTDHSETARPVRNEVFKGIKSFLTDHVEERPKIFYFAGHGTTINDSPHVCCADFDDFIAEKCGIGVSEIIEMFSEKAVWSILIFDCCRSPLQAAEPRVGIPVRTGGILVRENTIVVFSCAENEYSYEAASIGGAAGGGVFTHFVRKAIEKSFARYSKPVSLAKILGKARDMTSRYVSESSAKSQVPTILGAQAGDFFLMKTPAPRITKQVG